MSNKTFKEQRNIGRNCHITKKGKDNMNVFSLAGAALAGLSGFGLGMTSSNVLVTVLCIIGLAFGQTLIAASFRNSN